MEVPASATFRWEPDSTYLREPPFFAALSPEPEPLQDISGARALMSLGDSITTDHITPAGNIPVESPAGRYLIEHGVERQDFNTYGTRRETTRCSRAALGRISAYATNSPTANRATGRRIGRAVS